MLAVHVVGSAYASGGTDRRMPIGWSVNMAHLTSMNSENTGLFMSHALARDAELTI